MLTDKVLTFISIAGFLGIVAFSFVLTVVFVLLLSAIISLGSLQSVAVHLLTGGLCLVLLDKGGFARFGLDWNNFLDVVVFGEREGMLAGLDDRGRTRSFWRRSRFPIWQAGGSWLGRRGTIATFCFFT